MGSVFAFRPWVAYATTNERRLSDQLTGKSAPSVARGEKGDTRTVIRVFSLAESR